MGGYVYIMSNACFPNWYKVGKTKDIGKRRAHLSKTSTPFPFKIEFFIESNHYDELEHLVKFSLQKFRVNKRREFFDAPISEIKDTIVNIATNLDLGIKYLPIKSISDEELDLLSSRWIDDYDYSIG